MTEHDGHSPHEGRRCRYAWCTTRHGATIHPDDETHRSAGLLVPIVVRAPGAARRARLTEVEVGLLRRDDDDVTWLVIEDGVDVSLVVSVESARRLRAAVDDDQVLGGLLDRPGTGPQI